MNAQSRSRGLPAWLALVTATRDRGQFEAMLESGPVLPVLRRMLLEPAALTGAPEHAEGRRGRLVGNTTAELVPGDEAARALDAAGPGGRDGVMASVETILRRRSAAP